MPFYKMSEYLRDSLSKSLIRGLMEQRSLAFELAAKIADTPNDEQSIPDRIRNQAHYERSVLEQELTQESK